jgi:glycosyltransferase involved in cell wall biosynthesis
VIVDIICPVYNGARFLSEFFESLERQTHAEWRLWLRDDGSTDDSVELLLTRAATDSRLRFLPSEGSRLGPTRGFAWLLDRVPVDAAYVMFADQDDVWLPAKIERTLDAMVAAEHDGVGAQSTPTLVHTDLIVADESLRTVHSSFWQYAGLQPEPSILRRVVVQNPVTGAASMINRALRECVGPIPPQGAYHDWWCALAATAFGRVIAIHESLLLYRQHGRNVVGARDGRFPVRRLLSAILAGLSTVTEFRRGLHQSAAQAGAFLDRYGPNLSAMDRDFLRRYAAIPGQRLLRRKLDLLRLRTLPEQGALRTLGVLLRG